MRERGRGNFSAFLPSLEIRQARPLPSETRQRCLVNEKMVNNTIKESSIRVYSSGGEMYKKRNK